MPANGVGPRLLRGGGFHAEILGGMIAWSLPPLANRVATTLFSLFSMQKPKDFYLAPFEPLMTTSNLLGVAGDESQDGLSREHSLGSDGQLLFSHIQFVPVNNEGTTIPLLGEKRKKLV